ncbi:TPA: hypothetical protein N0F65_011072 [Lagenidium giganteum]|uniref:CHY-type domain-containing protein n=1 Tax=Lagenidium giganteum TaxID=4803 RepID=A0AAV2ZFB6_9STRA|nr:TPA: hypothetical protein N0F65_011072 [Lagenidium giganteum]
MCKHIENVQIAFRAPCCNRWFDCSECHYELSDHALDAAIELAFICKQCRKPFRKDMMLFGEEDERCPHCDNLFVLPAVMNDMANSGDDSSSRAATRTDKQASPDSATLTATAAAPTFL